jgi:hypothetical protein
MADDLVARLREEAECYKGKTQSCLSDAAERIEQLEAALQRYVCRCKDVTATGAQVCTHGIPVTSLCGWEARKALEGKDAPT